jgi:serine/threonine protein kinase/Tfp pilus assembly protein PilF
MIGETISHYRIIEKLGEGGMGVVYKALDTTLDRHVAIKFLPPHLSKDEDATRRFIHEAKAASALDHANIGTIHEVEKTDDGRTFIVMAYYEGETLRERIDRGNISVDEALDITSQVASGLARAHETEIVHRDIKPSNIIITKRGEAKIIDFGLAKLAGKTRLTKEGTTLGTVAYMSPEQAKGEEIDSRSDIFSLGAVFYELLTGEPPFKGKHEAALLYEIVHEEPELLSKLRADVQKDFQNIVDKALKKNASDRYQSAAAMVEGLTSLKAGVTPGISAISSKRGTLLRNVTITITSLLVLVLGYLIISRYITPKPSDAEAKRVMIAVLMFENLGNAEDEYFADGITEEITARLASIRGLGVIARTSVIQYKNTDKTIKQIGEELGVEYILEGTIRWQHISESQSQVRITPRLIKVSDATQLWADIYQEDISDIFHVQASVAKRVIEALDVTLLESELPILEAKPTENLDAYQAYLRGNYYRSRPDYSQENILLWVQMMQRAVELDPDFALAYAALSRAHSMMYHLGWDHTEERLSKSKAAVDRALELQPDLPQAHLALGRYYYWGFKDYDRALEELAIAEKGLPNDYSILLALAAIRRRQGKFETSVSLYARAIELNPNLANIFLELARTYKSMRMYSEADRHYDRSISLVPDQKEAYLGKAQNYWLWEGDTARARATLERMPGRGDWHWLWQELYEKDYRAALERISSISMETFEDEGYFLPKAQMEGYIHQLMGRPDIASALYDDARILLEAEAKARPDDYRVRISLGNVYARLGRKKEAIREGMLGVELMSVSQDALIGPWGVENLALIYTIVGEYGAALDQVEYLLSIPCGLSVPLLRLDPQWDPLRHHPRFHKLVDKKMQ